MALEITGYVLTVTIVNQVSLQNNSLFCLSLRLKLCTIRPWIAERRSKVKSIDQIVLKHVLQVMLFEILWTKNNRIHGLLPC